MANITAAMVKELRERTGVGMMDCKNALTETNGDMEAAIEALRKKGLAKAAKKAGRIAADGLIGVIADHKKGAVIEVNSETDFVARNDRFQDMVRQITSISPKAESDLARLLAMPYPGKKETVEQHVAEMSATIGEKLGVRRTKALSAKEGTVASYVHSKVADGQGKIGVLVSLESKADKGKLNEFGRQVAMHIAAANPLALTAEDLDKDLIERERRVYAEQAQASGKPKEIIEKMVEGRLRKEFYQQSVLMEQTFMGPGSDGKLKVGDVVKGAEKSLGSPVKVTAFVRYALGEGIEKKGDDFAAEVAKAVKGS